MVGRVRAITGGQSFIPFNVGGTAATLDMDFRNGGYRGATPSDLTVTRTGLSTSGLFTDATGSSYTVFAPNTARIISGSGLLVEEGRTQYLGVTDTPATQTTASLGTGSYTLWVIGTGSATPSAGTATITGAAAATAGAPNTFTVTVAGTVTVTVSGSLTRFQLENGAYPTSYIPNLGAAGTSVARTGDAVSITGSPFTAALLTTAENVTMYSDAVFVEPDTGGNVTMLQLDSGGTTNRTNFFLNATGQVTSLVTQSGVSKTSPTSGLTALTATNSAVKSAFVTGPTCLISANGAASVSTSPGAGQMPTGLTHLRLGNNSSTIAGGRIYRRIAYFPAALTGAQIQGMTA